MELLEDVVPGMWAEMLNDRSFEGITPCADWAYYDGSPTICDRQWTAVHQYGATVPYFSAPLTIRQLGLSVKKDMVYRFSGHFRAQKGAKLKVKVSLRAPLLDGKWITLASAKLGRIAESEEELSCTLKASGGSDNAAFEVSFEGNGDGSLDKLSLMPTNNLFGWRADVVEAIKEAKPAIIRWGGSVVDPGKYHWKDGIGSRDRRVPFRNQVWGRIDSNDVGIDEFCQFCELVGAEPLVCVSFADGAQSAGELVEYCNGGANTKWGGARAANGHPASYGVKYWQVGNEISGDNPEYLAQIPDFIRAIHQTSRGAEVLASFPSQKLLERAGGELAFVAPHHYTTDFAACEREIVHLGEMFQSNPAWNNIHLAITEWNISAGDWGVGRAKQMTLAAALDNARYLNVLIRHSDKVKIACRSNLANSFCGGLIETSPGGVLKRPSYYAMQLYATHALPVALVVTNSGSELDVVACASEPRDAVVVFAVNTKTEPARCALKFADFAKPVHPVSITTVADQQNAHQPDVMNHWNAPERVRATKIEIVGNELTIPALSVSAIECR